MVTKSGVQGDSCLLDSTLIHVTPASRVCCPPNLGVYQSLMQVLCLNPPIASYGPLPGLRLTSIRYRVLLRSMMTKGTFNGEHPQFLNAGGGMQGISGKKAE